MDQYGLIGKGIRHSFSPAYFQAKFIRLGIDAVYTLFDLEDVSEVRELIRSKPEIVGLNVTIPYKKTVIPFLDRLDPDAEKIGAVNTIKIDRSGEEFNLTGFNTDIIGFREALSPLISNRKDLKVLILGTGGSSKAVAYVLNDLNIRIQHVSRDKNKASLVYQDLNKKIIHDHLLIVNTTPVGMFPDIDSAPDIPYQFISDQHILFDLVYNPTETRFIKEGQKRGAYVESGLKMLYNQAEASWKIWQSH